MIQLLEFTFRNFFTFIGMLILLFTIGLSLAMPFAAASRMFRGK